MRFEFFDSKSGLLRVEPFLQMKSQWRESNQGQETKRLRIHVHIVPCIAHGVSNHCGAAHVEALQNEEAFRHGGFVV